MPDLQASQASAYKKGLEALVIQSRVSLYRLLLRQLKRISKISMALARICAQSQRLQERLVSLDAGEGSMLHKGLLMEGLKPMRTMLEADFGEPLADLYFFPSLQGENAVNKLFVCPLKAA